MRKLFTSLLAAAACVLGCAEQYYPVSPPKEGSGDAEVVVQDVTSAVWVMRLDGTGKELLVPASDAPRVAVVGKSGVLCYVNERETGKRSVQLFVPSAPDKRRFFRWAEYPSVAVAAAHASISPDGKLMGYFTTVTSEDMPGFPANDTLRLRIANAGFDYQTIGLITIGPKEKWGENMVGPIRFSPDGTKVAFISHPSDAGFMGPILTVASVNGSILHTFSWVARCEPAWSPDSKKIVAGNLEGGLVICDVETGERRVRELPTPGAPRFMDWSPDGAKVVYEWLTPDNGQRENAEVRIHDPSTGLTGSAPTNGKMARWGVAWLPGNRLLLPMSEDGTKVRVGVVDLTAKTTRWIFDDAVGAWPIPR